ncbi:sulfurtransferase TusA family protein [bacterium]|nr:sulfurtransferase TusA family protein [bacterium]
MEPDLRIDLRGEACPMNFVRIKLALDRLAPGKLLLARVDPGPVAADLERSLTAQGYRMHHRSESAVGAEIAVSRPE